jgi:hypothetical protein
MYIHIFRMYKNGKKRNKQVDLLQELDGCDSSNKIFILIRVILCNSWLKKA